MRAARLYLPTAIAQGAELDVDGDALHYIARVLRARNGDALTLFNGTGGEYSARVMAISKRAARVQVLDFDPVNRASALQVVLALGVSKGERMDLAIQKCTELGVNAIQPLLTTRSVVNFRDAQRTDKRVEHWRQVTYSACEQCERNIVPIVNTPTSLAQWLSNWRAAPTDIGLLLGREAAAPLSALPAPLGRVALLIGPEGGLDEMEQGSALAAGFHGLSLGPRTLRTETAAIAAVTAVQLQWGDLNGAT